MVRARRLQALLETDQIAPAQLIGDRASQPLGHPGGYVVSRPVLVPLCRFRQDVAQFLLQRRGEDGLPTIRGGMSAVLHALGAEGVVAFGNLADPIRRVASHAGDRDSRVALA